MTEIEKFDRVWQSRLGIDPDIVEVDPFQPITAENVAYLVNKYPFLQLINSEAMFIDEITPKFYTAKSGWIVHDYGEAISSSPGKYLYNGGDYAAFTKMVLKKLLQEEEEGGEDEGGAGIPWVNPGKGTIINQAYVTAEEMINLVLHKAWKGIRLVDGTDLMKWAAWAIGTAKGLQVEGYEPSEQDEERRERVLHAVLAERRRAAVEAERREEYEIE